MADLAEFLLERFAEDPRLDAEWREALRRMAQDLAVMEAEEHAAKQDYAAWVDGHRAAPPIRTLDPGLLPGLRRACQDLVTAYASHPDFRDEWRLT